MAVQASTNETTTACSDVRPPTEAVVAEHRAENQLHVKNEDRSRVSVKRLGRRWSNSTRGTSSTHLCPVKNGDADRDAEKRLRQGGVSGGDRRRQKEPNGKPPENALDNDSSRAPPAEIPHPAALVGAPGPDGKDDGQQPDHLGDHAVGVLEVHPAHQLRDFIK